VIALRHREPILTKNAKNFKRIPGIIVRECWKTKLSPSTNPRL